MVFVCGKEKERTSDLIYEEIHGFSKAGRVEKIFGKIKAFSLLSKEVIILPDPGDDPEELLAFFNLFSEVIMVVDSKKLKREKELASLLNKKDSILVNFEIKDSIAGKRMKKFLTYGMDKEADFNIMDISEKEKINFKVSHDGSIVPVWIEKESDLEESLNRSVIAIAVGVLLGINLVKLTGKMSE